MLIFYFYISFKNRKSDLCRTKNETWGHDANVSAPDGALNIRLDTSKAIGGEGNNLESLFTARYSVRLVNNRAQKPERKRNTWRFQTQPGAKIARKIARISHKIGSVKYNAP